MGTKGNDSYADIAVRDSVSIEDSSKKCSFIRYDQNWTENIMNSWHSIDISEQLCKCCIKKDDCFIVDDKWSKIFYLLLTEIINRTNFRNKLFEYFFKFRSIISLSNSQF